MALNDTEWSLKKCFQIIAAITGFFFFSDLTIKHETGCFITYQTPRGEMKMRRVAENFSRTTRCLICDETLFKVFDVTNFSIKKIYKNNLVTEKRIIFVSLLLLLFALEFVTNVWECLLVLGSMSLSDFMTTSSATQRPWLSHLLILIREL